MTDIHDFMLASTVKHDSPGKEFGRVLEPERLVVVFDVICGQEFVQFTQLVVSSVPRSKQYPFLAYLGRIVEIQYRPHELFGKRVWLLADLFARFRRLNWSVYLRWRLSCAYTFRMCGIICARILTKLWYRLCPPELDLKAMSTNHI